MTDERPLDIGAGMIVAGAFCVAGLLALIAVLVTA